MASLTGRPVTPAALTSMSVVRDASGSVLRVLRRRFAEGLFAPGQVLSVVDISEELSVSTTPVREALAQLVGEGLVDDARGPGFVAGPADASTVAGLYRLRGVILEAAVRALNTPVATLGDVEAVLGGVVAQAADRIWEREFERVQLRLGSALAAETSVFDRDFALAKLRAAAAGGLATFRAAVAAHHSERVSAAGLLWRTMMANAP